MSTDDRLINRTQAAAMLGVSVATFDRMILDGRAPNGFKVSARICVWKESAIRGLAKLHEAKACAK